MIYPESKGIVFDAKEFDMAEIFPVHDAHYGNPCFDERRFRRLINYIKAEPYRLVCFLGDLMENAVPGSKSDPLTQVHTPLEQREWVAELFLELKDHVICVTDGNHEWNRSTKMAGLYPLYDACCIAGIPERYRNAYAAVNVHVGHNANSEKGRSHKYVGFVTHKAKVLKNFASCDELDGFDFMLYGHDHEALDHPRAKLAYDRTHNIVQRVPIEMVNGGAFLDFGDYGARDGCRAKSAKMYKLVLDGKAHTIITQGFYEESLP